MFGYVIANPALLDEDQKRRYQACYCGLCHTIKAEFSSLCRLSLNYDMTFLVLLLSSLYEPEEDAGQRRCLIHPYKPRPYWRSDCTRYCAAMNVALAYYNCLDDWQDERRLDRLAEARLFRRACRTVEARYPRQAGAVSKCLRELSDLEQRGIPDPDRAANLFGALMGELFVLHPEDRWAPLLRTMGQALGRFVYILDAVMDLEEDLEKGRYNPLSAMAQDGRRLEDFQDDLSLLIGECADAFERLPLVQDAALLRNILYSGVWLRYDKAFQERAQSTKEGGPA